MATAFAGAPEPEVADTPIPESTPTPEPTAIPEPEDPQGLDRVAAATVRIVSQITLADPEFGTLQNVVGQGSGFLISADGLVVTNNHVVTGVGTLNVNVPGRREPVNARVVAASECSDLAVIQLPPGAYPYLEFYDGNLTIGTPIYAAGYPLGEPEYALVGGIISKLDADGETSWASVDQVLQHDAAINPGNSGGPLVNEDGQVVGIVYAGNLPFNQFFAIGLEVALPVLDTLKTGQNHDWIGVNGEAFVAGNVSGIWVWSVESGSPADLVGLAPGDVIIELERLALGRDGTMHDYCDVLQTRGSERVVGITVFSPRTGQILEGQLNGRPLQ
jgi:serine protease Do